MIVDPFRDKCVSELKKAGALVTGQGFGHVMELIDCLIAQGHTGPDTRNLVVSTFYQLATGGLLSPLTGNEDEWVRVSDTLEQNRRCSHVYREKGQGSYDARAVVFVDEQDAMFTRQPQSRRKVTFPYEPRTEYVRVASGKNNRRH